MSDIKLEKEICLLKIGIKDFFLIREVVKKTNVKVRIQRKAGFPFLMSNFKKRKMFILGFTVLALTMYIVSLFVWKVEIISYGEVDQGRILTKLSGMGIKTGILKNKINKEQVAEIIVKDLDDISWAFAKVEGYKLCISVAARKKPPEIEDAKIPRDIVAKKDGVIKSVLAKSGFATVKEGDTVRRGDILIMGEVTFKDGRKKPLHSEGEVYARTWYGKRERIETTSFEKINTGRKIERYYCNLGQRKIFFFNNDAYSKNYDKIDQELSGGIFNKIGLPVELWKSEFYENKLIERHVDYDVALSIARDKAREGAKPEIPLKAVVVAENELYTHEGDDTFIELIIECIEEIGENHLTGG